MNLIPEWRKCWRLTSFQMAALIIVLNTVAGGWSFFQGHIDPILWATMNVVLGSLAGIARLIQQPKVTQQ
jgi:hypothetical protein